MFNSIRIKLTIWYLSILALIILAFAFAVYFLVEQNLNQTTNKNLSAMTRNVTEDLLKEEQDLKEERKPDESGSEDLQDSGGEESDEIGTIEEAITEEINDLKFIGFQFSVFDQQGKNLVTTTDKRVQEGLSTLSIDSTYSEINGDNEVFRVHQTSLILEGKQFRLFVSQSLADQDNFLSFLKSVFYIAVPIALLLAGIGGYFLARRSLIPVVSMSERAANIGSTNLNERLPIENENDELGGLAAVFNSLLSRLENSFNQQQRFMADASHELRTPLSIIRTESEVAISNDRREAADYKDSLAIVHGESKRLTNIVEDLFLLARADRGQVEPHLKKAQLDEIITDSVRAVKTLADKRNVKVRFSELPEMALRADESLLHRLFLNLLDNAIKYNRQGGTISIDAQSVGAEYHVTISDTGIGIPAAIRSKIFDRFYRADEARGHGEGNISSGAGLGLSIALWIAQAHHGKLVLDKSGASGSTFRLELPIRS